MVLSKDGRPHFCNRLACIGRVRGQYSGHCGANLSGIFPQADRALSVRDCQADSSHRVADTGAGRGSQSAHPKGAGAVLSGICPDASGPCGNCCYVPADCPTADSLLFGPDLHLLRLRIGASGRFADGLRGSLCSQFHLLCPAARCGRRCRAGISYRVRHVFSKGLFEPCHHPVEAVQFRGKRRVYPWNKQSNRYNRFSSARTS